MSNKIMYLPAPLWAIRQHDRWEELEQGYFPGLVDVEAFPFLEPYCVEVPKDDATLRAPLPESA